MVELLWEPPTHKKSKNRKLPTSTDGKESKKENGRYRREGMYRREKAVVVSCDYLHGLVDSLVGWVFVYRH